MKQPSDRLARERAIDPNHSYLVQAPAGSGKTELLTDRILALLARAQRPEEIVAITFTRKAAAEMHARVLEKLASADSERPQEPYKVRSWELACAAMQRNREMGWDLLEFPARLSIRTIDALCAHLVHGMPWVSGLGGMPAIAHDARVHYEAAAQACLDMVETEESVERFLEHMDVNILAAREVLADMLASRDQWQSVLANADDMDVLRQCLQEVVEQQLAQLLDAMPTAWAKQLAGPLRFAAQTLGPESESWVLSDWDGEAFEATVEALPRWQALAAALLTGTGSLRKRVDARQGFPPKTAEKERITEWLGTYAEGAPWVGLLARVPGLPQGYSPEQARILSNLIEVLWLASAQLKLCFAQASEVDFTEISQRALLALGRADEPGDLLLSMDKAIQHLLVDEFQDTSHSQVQLLEKLTSGWEQSDGRTLFLVGDPMQSIYRFRKAEVGLFLRVSQAGLLGAVPLETLQLSNNFRSHPRVVDWVNEAGVHLFSERADPLMGSVSYAPSVAFNSGDEGLRTHFHPAWHYREQHEDYVQAAAQHAQEQSRATVLELVRAALDRYPDRPHPVAILVRTRSNLRGLVRLLQENNIPCRAVELESLAQRPVVADLVQLIRALSHPGDRLAYLALLRSPLCGLTLHSLHTLCASCARTSMPELLASANQQDYLPDQWQRLQHVSQVLLDAKNRSGQFPFAAWVQRCWRRLGGDQAYAQPTDQADAEQVFALLEELCPYSPPDQEELEQRIRKLYATPQNAGSAVEVMTIHKSKGLEFESVILYGLHHISAADKDPLIRIEQTPDSLLLGPLGHRGSDERDPIARFLAQREKYRAEQEVRRLMYVAVTRARQELHLCAELGVKADSSVQIPDARSLLSRLWSVLQVPDVPQWTCLAQQAQDIQSKAPLSVRTLRRLPLEALTAAQTQTDFIEHRYQAWQWSPELGAERAMGDVAHAWLERLGRDGINHWSEARLRDSLSIMALQLRRAGVAQAQVNDASQIVLETLLATCQSARGQWLLSVSRAHREWSLLDGTGRVSIIDLAISQEDHWLVVDYKTSVPHDNETVDSFAARMSVAYAEQLERYCQQVSGLDGRPAKAVLYFPRIDLWLPYQAD